MSIGEKILFQKPCMAPLLRSQLYSCGNYPPPHLMGSRDVIGAVERRYLILLLDIEH
jgi:hypothetical protein